MWIRHPAKPTKFIINNRKTVHYTLYRPCNIGLNEKYILNYDILIYRNINVRNIFIYYDCEEINFNVAYVIVSLREERGLGVFENRALKKICGPKRDEVIGEWRKLDNGELYDLYSSPDIIRVMKSR